MENILNAADKNPYLTTTYIGNKCIKDSPTSYEAVAKANRGNFFQIDKYDKLVKYHGEKAMQEVIKRA